MYDTDVIFRCDIFMCMCYFHLLFSCMIHIRIGEQPTTVTNFLLFPMQSMQLFQLDMSVQEDNLVARMLVLLAFLTSTYTPTPLHSTLRLLHKIDVTCPTSVTDPTCIQPLKNRLPHACTTFAIIVSLNQSVST
mmetsp:Transcript_36287/g.58645  ORF Transcript_36287/g.58645 Transcript_36287/m.58645 type:complete len:134 (+) Transcript_36287:45-446(+)